MASSEESRTAVVIADDEAHVRGLLKVIVNASGAFVAGQAENGEGAVSLHRQLRPDLVFLDVHMPRIDGVLALKAIRLIDSRVWVVMLTSVNSMDVVEQCMEAGADTYILKDASAEVLADRIAQAIEQARVAFASDPQRQIRQVVTPSHRPVTR